ncbi:MAG: hypothetical protein SFZ03_06570 [Candidatus Melainabacteria bacterium]|nr:hypothetical protein [Candidatus Melainabacteria bacterium]
MDNFNPGANSNKPVFSNPGSTQVGRTSGTSQSSSGAGNANAPSNPSSPVSPQTPQLSPRQVAEFLMQNVHHNPAVLTMAARFSRGLPFSEKKIEKLTKQINSVLEEDGLLQFLPNDDSRQEVIDRTIDNLLRRSGEQLEPEINPELMDATTGGSEG